jgi:hypothetical protein
VLHGDSSLSYTVKNTVLHCEQKRKVHKVGKWQLDIS